jgi:parallel beta-helix repeat protein
MKNDLAFIMRRGIAVVWISVLLILTCLVLVNEYSDYFINVKGATHYVNETGSDGAYTSIQDAINASFDGDTVFVYNGTYYENIIVNKTINLIGENKDNTTINGSGTGDVVAVSADFVNITGFTVRNSGTGAGTDPDSGIELEYVSNCRVFDNSVFETSTGINIYHSHENIVTDNNISNIDYEGIWLRYSTNNSITHNTILFTWVAIYDDDSSNHNTFSYNEITYNEEGIWLLYSSDNIVSHNNCTNNDWFNIYLQTVDNTSILNNNCSYGYLGVLIYDSYNVTINDNIMLLNEDFGVDCQNTNYVDIRNNIVESPFMGFHIFNIIGLNLTNNHISATFRALDLSNSLYGHIANNTIVNCPEGGFYIWSISEFNLFTNNTFYNNTEAFWADVAEHNTISENTFYNNTYALSVQVSMSCDILKNNFYSNEYAIYFWGDVQSWNITNNNISNNTHGIFLAQMDNDNNIISENLVADNEFAINISQSNNNLIYHNNFINNTYQASDDSTNNWDNDYPLGGNFWSDYSGVDLFKGPNQDILGSDGIGDTNYSIDSDSVDNYPLMEGFTTREFENHTILNQGWNLVSIPLIQEDQNISKVLEMIEGYYDKVSWYDASDPADHWKNYIVGKPFGNDLMRLNETMGFFIRITKPGDTIFLYNGTEPTQNVTIQIYEGWNMVGYPSESNYNRTDGLNNLTFGVEVDEIEWFNATTKTWHEMNENDHFVPTRGYWVHATSDCEWEVPL